MKCKAHIFALAVAAALVSSAQVVTDGVSFTADSIAVDNVTKAAVASGHVHAVSGVISFTSEYMERDVNGVMRFRNPTCVTTCTNEVGHTHWNVSGDLEFQADDHVLLRNAVLRFYEVPVFWLPYLYYPLDTKCGFSWMPGYTGRWGAYLLTKYRYDIAGDPAHADNTWWLRGDTRFDMRYKNGLALGEDLWWNLGDFGGGSFNFYYAWDQDALRRYGTGGDHVIQGSDVKRERYLFSVEHKWFATERDVVRLRGSHYSDSFVRNDFERKSFFDLKSQWLSFENSGVFWEHLENRFSFGAEASGRLNRFYSMTERLPEVYFDVNPTPVFDLPVNYESRNRIGYMQRNYAKYGAGEGSVFGVNPALWADYKAFRVDSYHRLSAPFRAFDDVLSVVPRLGGRATYWNEGGETDLTGFNRARDAGDFSRFIGEAGITFAARGTAWIDDAWRHMVEPYMDVLAQEAWYDKQGANARPYAFDNLDASFTWEDQFAGRSRNLPYSYYGVTPGFRQTWSRLQETGSLRRILDLDVYTALQFNEASYMGANDMHRLAWPDSPNYGDNCCEYVPGARLKWSPFDDTSLGARAEYDSDRKRIAYGSVFWGHKICKDLKYNVAYTMRDHRYWDFSSVPYNPAQMSEDTMNLARMRILDISAEYQVCDWLAVGPHMRWDVRDDELDTVGFWVDYLTDCLGFRLFCEYENDFRTIYGYHYDDDFSVGFYIYLRAFGPSGIFSSR